MMTHDYMPLARSDCDILSAAMDHVRLSYLYLDDGDLDAYCSLFAEPDVAGVRRATRSVRHSVSAVCGAGRRVVAIGRVSGDHGAEMDFVDVFAVADNGLLIDRTTFLFATAEAAGGAAGPDMDQPGADVV